MKIVLHTGAHFTEEDRLFKTLLRNKAEFAEKGVSVPGPGRYRPLLRDTLAALDSNRASQEARSVLLDAILDEAQADRVILSHVNMFGAPRACLRDGILYHMAPLRIAQLDALFDTDELEVFICMRNPAALLPALFESAPQPDMVDFLRGYSPVRVRWSETLRAMREAAPKVKITTWCFEDMPMLWASVIREMAGLEPTEKIVGGFDLLREIMIPEGMQRFRAYLKAHPNMSEHQKRRVIVAFLDKYANDEALEEELNAPGWTNQLVEELTEQYEEDLNTIANLPGVKFLDP